MFVVYVLYSDKLNKRYIGSTRDLNNRLKEHNTGKSKFTKAGNPWKLIYQEYCQSNQDARRRELILKSGVGRKFLDQILNENNLGF
jgi:putative endonuclease